MQEAHLCLLEAAGIPRARLLRYGLPPPRGVDGAWVSICIDDLNALDEEDEETGKDDGDGEAVFLAALDAYGRVGPKPDGLKPKQEKPSVP